jgi:hypothetical protein
VVKEEIAIFLPNESTSCHLTVCVRSIISTVGVISWSKGLDHEYLDGGESLTFVCAVVSTVYTTGNPFVRTKVCNTKVCMEER